MWLGGGAPPRQTASPLLGGGSPDPGGPVCTGGAHTGPPTQLTAQHMTTSHDLDETEPRSHDWPSRTQPAAAGASPGDLLGGLHPLNRANIDYTEMEEEPAGLRPRLPGDQAGVSQVLEGAAGLSCCRVPFRTWTLWGGAVCLKEPTDWLTVCGGNGAGVTSCPAADL